MHKKLNQIIHEIEKHDNIVIMGHKNADLDVLASAVCMFQIVKSYNKDCYIYLDAEANNPSIEKAKFYLKRYNKTIYLIRHSTTEKNINFYDIKNKQIENKLLPLSIKGEEKASKFCKKHFNKNKSQNI